MKKLYRFYWDCGRMGSVEGLFIEEEETVKKYLGRTVYFGEILGKHSDVYGDINESDFKVITDDQSLIDKLESLMGSDLCGHNPITRIMDYEADGGYDE